MPLDELSTITTYIILMAKTSLNYYQIAVNARSLLASHGELVTGQAMLLCLYCAEQRNGGIIVACKKWTARQWLIMVGLESMPDDLEGLWHWDGDDLKIDFYNSEAETQASVASQKARKAANARWSKNDAQEDGLQCTSTTQAEQGQEENHAQAMQESCSSNANMMHEQCMSNAKSESSNAKYSIVEYSIAKESIGKDSQEKESERASTSAEYKNQAEVMPARSLSIPQSFIESRNTPEFQTWLSVMSGMRPTWGKVRLSQSEMLNAIDVFERSSLSNDDFDLLKAFFASKTADDRRGKVFYRPDSFTKFLTDLNDVYAHAERWRNETRWKKSKPKPKVPAPSPTVDEEQGMSLSEQLAYIHEVKTQELS